jgi:IPT/TIG domain
MKRGSSHRTVVMALCLLLWVLATLAASASVSAMEPPPSVYLSPIDPDILQELKDLGIHVETIVGDPIVEDVNPNGGLTTGGTGVVITGTDFTGATKVTFGGTKATDFTVDSDTQITATAPAHAAGTVQVQVTTPAGSSPDTSADDFTYVAPPATTAPPATAAPTTAAPTTAAPTATTVVVSTTLAAETGDGGLSGGWIAFIAVIAVLLLVGISAAVYMLGKRSGTG